MNHFCKNKCTIHWNCKHKEDTSIHRYVSLIHPNKYRFGKMYFCDIKPNRSCDIVTLVNQVHAHSSLNLFKHVSLKLLTRVHVLWTWYAKREVVLRTLFTEYMNIIKPIYFILRKCVKLTI